MSEEFTDGDALFDSGDTVGALREFLKISKCVPHATGLNGRLAKCFSRLAQFEKAVFHAEQELLVDPSNGEMIELRKQIRTAFDAKVDVPPIHLAEAWKTAIPQRFFSSLQSALHRFSYKGVAMLKNPFDLAIYSLLLWDLKPGAIFEIGSHSGGSALWMADLVTSYGIDTKILSVDVIKVEDVQHSAIEFFEGDANRLADTFRDEMLSLLPSPWLVIDDASHEYETSKSIVDFFHPRLVSGDYFVIEDGIISDFYPEVFPGGTSGPHKAIRYLLETHASVYSIDRRYCDFFGYNATWCTNGFIRRK
jgi:cephalosporin hydroxylase